MLSRNDEWEESLLRAIVEGTATAIGEEFFNALVMHLAAALQVSYAFVAEFADTNTRVRTLAYWYNDRLRDNVEFNLSGTPCEDVLAGNICHHPEGVARLFPADLPLTRMAAESYLGVPLIDATGQVLGHLVVIDTKPMPPEPRGISILKIFAARARAELERRRAQQALVESEARLARILDSAMDAIVTIDTDLNVRLFNRAAEKVFRCRAAAAVGKPFTEFLSAEFQATLTRYLQALRAGDVSHPDIWIPEGMMARRSDGEPFPIEGTISQVPVERQHLYTLILRDINERKRTEAELEKLNAENRYLQEEIKTSYNFEEIVGLSASMKKIFQMIEQVSSTDSTVLIIGETGTGKELIARAIHNRSRRQGRALIKVNCAALSPGLIESEFFGHEKGAFTGAITQRIGRFELADRGTIFLDEIGEISAEVQAKLLRVLQEQEFERVGGNRTLKADVRVIAATNRDLQKEVADNRFRADLYYRLNVFPIKVPALRERKEDIPLLTQYFVDKLSLRLKKPIKKIGRGLVDKLMAYNWPGNIRELENVIERAVILAREDTLELHDDLFMINSERNQPSASSRLDDIERNHILTVLASVDWVIEGPKGAANILDIKPNTLRSRMQRLGIRK